MKKVHNKLLKSYEEMFNYAVQQVEIEARKILKQHDNLDEFIMAMGCAFFTHKDGNKNHIDVKHWVGRSKDEYGYQPKYVKDLAEFIGEWNKTFFLTGDAPMRFTAEGLKITDW